MKPILYIMVGLSGSGKSSIVKEISKNSNAIIIASDDIRGEICDGGVPDQSKNEEVFKIFHDRIRKNLEKKKNVIADATNITIKSRRAILNKINGIECEKICYIVPKKYEDCLIENKDRDYPVPDEVIKKQMYKFQIPFYEEGFDRIIIDDLDIESNNINTKPIKNMFGFNQLNPHHNDTLDVHCDKVAKMFSLKYNDEVLIHAAFFHDIGKTMCQTFDKEGIAHYYQHHCVGAYYVLSNLRHTPYGYRILDICFLINYHMMPFNWNTDKIHNKWKKIFGEDKYNMLIYFNECDKTR